MKLSVGTFILDSKNKRNIYILKYLFGQNLITIEVLKKSNNNH